MNPGGHQAMLVNIVNLAIDQILIFLGQITVLKTFAWLCVKYTACSQSGQLPVGPLAYSSDRTSNKTHAHHIQKQSGEM